jgi:amino acid adenylation domain-containing protein
MLSEPSAQAYAYRLSPQQGFLLARVPGAVTQVAVRPLARLEQGPLRAALNALVQRHESLRTTFETPVGARAPVAQSVHEWLEPVCEFGSAAVASDAAALAELLSSEAAKLDLARGPSIRALLAQRTDGAQLLVLTALAACADARSLVAVAEQLTAAGQAEEVEPIQHADYAEWRHELANGEDPDAVRGRALWSGIADQAGQPRLLFARRSSSGHEAGAAYESVALELGPVVRRALAAAVADARVNEEQFVHGAWLVTLARVSGNRETLSAYAAAGRSQPDLAGAIGPYAQAIGLRISIEPETVFLEVLDRLTRARAEGERWQDYALEPVLQAVADGAVAGFSAAPVDTGGDGIVQALTLDPTTTTLELGWLGAGRAELRYDPSVHDRLDAEELAAQFSSVLGAAAADSSATAGTLPLLDGQAEAAMLELATGPLDATPLQPLHHQIEAISATDGGRTAVVSGDQQLSYAELNRRANQLAHHLIAAGVERDQPVGLCVQRSPTMVTALLAIMKAGAGYLPLNSAHPSRRLAHQLQEAGVRVLVAESALIDRLPAVDGLRVVSVDSEHDAIAGASAENPPRVSQPDDLAYVIYTSGSTGMPKGVAVTHGNLANYTLGLRARLGLAYGEPRSSAVVSELSTDLGNTGIFPVLAGGGAVHVLDPDQSIDGAAVALHFARHEIELLKITPTHLRALLAASDGCLPTRWLILGGEVLTQALVDRVHGAGAGCRVINHYGPTEATIGCCTLDADEPSSRPEAPTIPIGRPLPNARTYVLDERRQPVPAGVAGELCIGGAGVARGYLNRPEETAERFVADPQGGRMYRTGDRARVHRDGAIEFLGRADDQLKIRGFRVEPGEVEAVLLRHPAVREAAVVARDAGDGDQQLVAYYIEEGGLNPDPADLEASLAESLPEYMLPARWMALDAFPMTSSGKIDRRELPDPGVQPGRRGGEFVAPRDELEQDIASIWAALLGIEEVGVFDDFFALGGHSLLATQAIMRIRRSHGNIPLGALFNSPTVAALADVIRARSASRGDA